MGGSGTLMPSISVQTTSDILRSWAPRLQESVIAAKTASNIFFITCKYNEPLHWTCEDCFGLCRFC